MLTVFFIQKVLVENAHTKFEPHRCFSIQWVVAWKVFTNKVDMKKGFNICLKDYSFVNFTTYLPLSIYLYLSQFIYISIFPAYIKGPLHSKFQQRNILWITTQCILHSWYCCCFVFLASLPLDNNFYINFYCEWIQLKKLG